MKTKIKALITGNFRYEISKDQVIKTLMNEEISIKTYNNFIFKTLLGCKGPFEAVIRPANALNTNILLDKEFIKNLFLVNRKGEEHASDKKTLFEKERVSIGYYADTLHLPYRLVSRMMTKDEVLARFKEYSARLGLSSNIGRECAEYLRKGLQTYIQKIMNRCNGKITIPTLKISLGKYLRLFNGLDMF
ncbi:hypothetical protein M970_112050 [Encephalitozoon cuniculi EcunIII-L]|nr:hypothetical protein M970_112050 [Encephalitozoon cuniculi EcunIII-L]